MLCHRSFGLLSLVFLGIQSSNSLGLGNLFLQGLKIGLERLKFLDCSLQRISLFLLLGCSKSFVSCLDGLINCLGGSVFSCSDVFVAISFLIRKLSDCILSGLSISLGLIYHLLLSIDFISVLSSLDLRLCLLCGLLSGIGLLNMILSSSCVLLSSSGNRFISYLDSLIRNCGSSLLSLSDVFSSISLLVRKLNNFILSSLGISLGLLYRCLLSLDIFSGLGCLDLRLCLLCGLLSGIGLLNMILSSSSVLLSSSGNRFISERDSLIRNCGSSLLSFGQILGRLLIRKPSDCFLSSLGISLSLLYRCLLSLDFVSGLSCLDLRLCLLRGLLGSIGLLNMILSSSSVLLSCSSDRFISERDSLIRNCGSSLLSIF